MCLASDSSLPCNVGVFRRLPLWFSGVWQFGGCFSVSRAMLLECCACGDDVVRVDAVSLCAYSVDDELGLYFFYASYFHILK